jgi:hypothetical protein
MAEIRESIDMLPSFPPFLSTDQEVYSQGDIVWILTTDDFQVGYILGFAESPNGSSISAVVQYINGVEESFSLETSSIYDLSFTRRKDDTIDFYNRKTTQSGRIFPNGVTYVYGADGSMYARNGKAEFSVTSNGDVSISGQLLTEKAETKKVEIQKYEETLASKTSDIAGPSVENVSGKKTTNVAGSEESRVIGDVSSLIVGKESEVIANGRNTNIAFGGDTEILGAGNYLLTVVGGSATITTPLGSINLVAGTGTINLVTAGGISLATAGVINLVGRGLVAPPLPVIPGLGPFNCLPMCPIAMVPHSGNICGSPV